MDGTRQRKGVYGEKKKEKKKNKVEEIQLANLASLGSLASNNVEEIQLANLVSLGSHTSNHSICHTVEALATIKKIYDTYVYLGKLGHHWKLFPIHCQEAPPSDQYITGSAGENVQWTQRPWPHERNGGSQLNLWSNLWSLRSLKSNLSLVSKGPMKLIQRVKIAHSFLQSVSNLLHFIVLSFPM